MNDSLLRMWNGRAGRWARAAVAGVVLLAVAFHVFTTVLMNTPNNPVRQKTAQALSGYFDPVFTQDWHLFAPNPVNSDRGMLVRARLSSGAVTGYADVTSTVIADQLHDPLPSRAARQITRGAGNFMNAISQVQGELSALHHPSTADEFTPTQLAELSEPTRNQYLGAKDVVADVASWQAHRLWGPDVRAVQVKLVSYNYPRFSQRDKEAATGPGSVAQLDQSWWPVDAKENAR